MVYYICGICVKGIITQENPQEVEYQRIRNFHCYHFKADFSLSNYMFGKANFMLLVEISGDGDGSNIQKLRAAFCSARV